MDQPSIPLGEFAARRKRLADEVGDRGMAGVLVWGQGGASFDFFGETMYLTNHHPMIPHAPLDPALTGGGYAAVLIPVSGEAVLVTTSLNDPDQRMGIGDVRQDNRLPEAIGAAIEEKGLANEVIGLVGRETLLAYLDAELRAAAPNVTFKPCDEILNYHRMIKSPAELDMMRYAADKGNDWMTATIAAMVPGVTEADVVATGLDRFIRDGGVQYDVAIAAGAKSDHYWGSSTIPHWNTTRPLEVGDMVHCDLWGLVDSYMTDFARSTVVGNDPTADQLRVLEDAIGIIEAIVAEIRPGRPISDLYFRGAEFLKDHGYVTESGSDSTGANFVGMYPSVGHAIGLGIEGPQMMADQTQMIEEGMVLACEAMIGAPGVGAANFEHNVIVTANGVENLTAQNPSRPWENA